MLLVKPCIQRLVLVSITCRVLAKLSCTPIVILHLIQLITISFGVTFCVNFYQTLLPLECELLLDSLGEMSVVKSHMVGVPLGCALYKVMGNPPLTFEWSQVHSSFFLVSKELFQWRIAHDFLKCTTQGYPHNVGLDNNVQAINGSSDHEPCLMKE